MILIQPINDRLAILGVKDKSALLQFHTWFAWQFMDAFWGYRFKAADFPPKGLRVVVTIWVGAARKPPLQRPNHAPAVLRGTTLILKTTPVTVKKAKRMPI